METGDKRSGVVDTEYFSQLLSALKKEGAIVFEGVFSHEGHTYGAPDTQTASEWFLQAQKDTLAFVQIAQDLGMPCQRVSIGSTPGIMSAKDHATDILDGITEIRPGTYIFMDAGQGHLLGTYEHCAATVLATIISKPTAQRTIADAGAKALTMQSRPAGICQTTGKGILLKPIQTTVDAVFDEHTIFSDAEFNKHVQIGDTIRIIPNHICPVVNLYDVLYVVDHDQVIQVIPILGRGKTT